MRTEQALQEFLASRIAANLSPATISWYKDRLLPFARSCPTLPRQPERLSAFWRPFQAARRQGLTSTGPSRLSSG